MKLLSSIDENKDIVNKEYLTNNYQAKLVSGTNIKTVNSNSLLGSGNISVGTITGVSINGTSIATSGVANITSVPTNILTHFMSKTYTGILGGDNNEAGSAFYVGSIRPTSFTDTWEVCYRVHAWVPSNGNYETISEVHFVGTQNMINAYKIFNHFTNTGYKPCGYHCIHRLKQAGYTAGYGHAFGVNLQDSNNRNTSGVLRSITFEIVYQKNCTVTLNDTAVKYADWPGTGTTNYENINNYNFTSNGLQETGDNDSVGVLRSYYDRVIIGDVSSLFPQNLCTYTTSDKLQPFVTSYSTGTTKAKNTSTFRIGAPIFFYSSWTTLAAGNYPGDNTMSLANNGISLQYTTNCGSTLTLNKPVYLVGIPNGASYTLADTWWTQTLPTTDDGKIYIHLGIAFSNYQISWQPEHPIYWYKNGALRLYTGLKSESAASGGTELSLVTTGEKYSWNSKGNGTVTSITLQATGPIAIDSSAAITTSGTRTISHANSGVTTGTYRSVTVNATGHVTAGTNPTTLSGYGITDAKINNGTITLGSNTITPLTSFTETDPVFGNSAASGITEDDIVEWSGKQEALVSGENIKTINGLDILGSGNLIIGEGGIVATDVEINGVSITNNSTANLSVDGIYNAIDNKIALQSTVNNAIASLTLDYITYAQESFTNPILGTTSTVGVVTIAKPDNPMKVKISNNVVSIRLNDIDTVYIGADSSGKTRIFANNMNALQSIKLGDFSWTKLSDGSIVFGGDD